MPGAVVQQVTDRLQHDAAFRALYYRQPQAALQEYDLTDEERQTLIVPGFSWLIEGELAGMARPQSDETLALLPALRVRAIVSLTEEPLSSAACAQHGLVVAHVPVADMTAPSVDQITAAVAAIERFRAAGRPTVVHCNAGMGRTGAVLAGALVARGVPVGEAIARVRAARPGSFQTAAQVDAVEQYARHRSGEPRRAPRRTDGSAS